MLHHKIYGQGDPILILHGLFGFSDNWQTIAKGLSEKYMVITVDLRNHGRSFHAAEHTYSLMAEDLKAFMEENWIFSAKVIGHSMGGKVAMQFALDYPDFVEKLVSVDMAPSANERGHDTIFETLLAIDIDHLERRQEAEEFMKKHIPQVGVRQFLLKNMSRKKEGGYEWKMNLKALWENYDHILEAVSAPQAFDKPTLFIGGTKSDYIKNEDFPLIQELFPQANVQMIEDAGHWVHADKPDELLKMLFDFFDELMN